MRAAYSAGKDGHKVYTFRMVRRPGQGELLSKVRNLFFRGSRFRFAWCCPKF